MLVTSGKALASSVATKSRHLSYSSVVSHSLHVVRPSLNLARSCLSYDACTSDDTPSGMLYSNHGQNYFTERSYLSAFTHLISLEIVQYFFTD